MKNLNRLHTTALVFLFSVSVASAEFLYTINSNKTVTINGHTNPVGALVIPATIDGYPVTSIGEGKFRFLISGEGAFASTSLTSVIIPDSVTSIGERAFEICTNLTSVTIGNGVTNIGNDAFYECSGLTSVIIPDSVTSIGESAFEDCTMLTSVTIGNGVTTIGNLAFEICSNLKSVKFTGDAPAALSNSKIFTASTPTIYRRKGAKGWSDIFDGCPVSIVP
jgi:hypothetical protein